MLLILGLVPRPPQTTPLSRSTRLFDPVTILIFIKKYCKCCCFVSREGMAGIVPIDNFRREAALLFKSIRLEDIDWIGSLQSGTFGGYSFVQTSSLILSLRFQIRTLVWNSSDSYMQSHSATVLCRE
eukprot:m.176860 g.176860  ORF g.176860 m.176860 type:complete len:127 (+) comp39148_c0_seq29:886-1266(+)